MLNLRDQRFRYDHVGDDERRSTAELAPWLFAYDDKLIVNKDSGLLACYAIGGIDAEALMNGEVNQWAQQLQGVLNGLKQWPPTLWWTVHRRAESNWPTGQFLNPIAAQLDAHMAARQAAGGKNFVNRHYLSLLGNALANKMGLQDRLTHAIRRSDSLPKALFEAIRTHFFAGSAFAYTAGELDLAVARYEEMLATTTQALPDMQFERLRGDALHAFLHACASIVHAGQARVALPNNVLMDAALGDAVIEPRGDHLVIRGFRTKYTAAIQIKQWPTPPDGARVRKLERLLTLPVELTLSLCWRKLHRDDALRLLKARKYYFDLTKFNPLTYVAAALAKKKDMEGVTPRADKAAAVAEVESIIKEIEEDTIGYGPANLTILVHADSPEKLQDAVDLVENELRSARLLPIRETFHLVSAYAGTLPGQWGEIVRWIEFSSAHIAHLAPVFTVRPGDSINGYLTEQLKRICPALVQFLTEHGTAVNVNFHALDKGHVLVVGPTRGGKTVLINLLLVLFARYGKVRVIRFDRDRSCRIPTLLTGGTWINTRDSETRINPLVLLADKRHWLFLTEWIKQLAGTVGSAFDADDAKSLHEAMEMTAGLPAASWRLWRLQTIWLHLPPGKLKDALAPWIEGGAYGAIFDHAEDDFGIADNLCIEMGGVLVAPKAAELFFDLMLYRIEDMLNQQTELVPTVIYAEEAGDLLRHPWFAARMDGLLKRLGKKLCNLILTVQSPEDGVNSPQIKASLRDNIATYFYLPNKSAHKQSLAQLYATELNLNPKQIQQIATAIPKKQYLLVQEGISRLFSTDLDAFALAYCRSDALAQNTFDAHWQQGHGKPGWEAAYLDAMSRIPVPEETSDEAF